MKTSKAVSNIASVLSLFSIEKEEIGVREASQRLGISASNVHRLLASLEYHGFVEKTPERRYKVGIKLFQVGALYPYHFRIRKIVSPHAEEMAKLYRTGSHFAIFNQKPPYSAIIIDRITGSQSASYVHRVAINVPLHSSAVGKTILAFLPSEKTEEIIRDLILTKFTKNTICNERRLIAELKRIKKEGFAVDRQEMHPNTYCVAAPVFEKEKFVGSLSLSCSEGRINEINCMEIGRVLKERARFISSQLI